MIVLKVLKIQVWNDVSILSLLENSAPAKGRSRAECLSLESFMDLSTGALNSFLIDNVSKEVFMNYRCAPQFTNTTQSNVHQALFDSDEQLVAALMALNERWVLLPISVACFFSM